MATRLALVNARYELGQALGTSGEAQAYVARDTRTGVDVVLKVVSPGSEAARVRLVAEFERLAALGHAALPEVVGLGEVAPGGPLATGAVFLAIARLDGDDARRVCTDLRAAARARLVARIVFDAAGALSGLHDAGLVHHDVKPEHLIATSDGRFRLIDLGLVRPKGSASTEVHGTLSYLSPDALAGSTDPAVDLYALGATAYELLTGAPPYRATDPRGLLEAQAEPLPPPPGPPALAALVMALLALDPAMRPTHAARVRDELVRSGLVAGERLVDPPGRVRRSPSFVASPTGRGAALEALGHALAGASVVALVGPTGSGRSRLVAELERRDAIAALRAGRAPGRMFGPSLRDAARELGVLELVTTDAPLRARSAFLARVVDALEERQATLHLASHAGVPLLELAALFDPARGSRTARLVIELEDEAAGALCVATRAGLVARVDLPPLDRAEVEALCERVLGVRDEELARLAEQRSLGRPRALLDLLWAAERRASLRAARSGGGVATAITVTDLRGAELTALDEELATAVAALSKDALGLLAELALLGRPVTLTELARAPGARSALPRSIAELERAGCVSSTGSALVLGSRRVAEAVLARVPAPAALGERLIAQALRQGALLDAAAVATAIGAPDAQARTVAALRQLLDGPGAERAAELLLAPGESRARALAAGLPGAEGAALEGELLVEAAEYEAAISRLREAVDGLAGALTDRPRYVLARALRLAGRSDEALAAARALGAASPAGRALTARLLLDRGDAEGALLSLRPEDQAIDALEIRVVACTLRGQLDEARGALARLGERLAGESVLRRSRGEGLRGLVAQADCALESAALAYERALRLAEETGDLHGAAVYAQNLGGALRELGEHARAQAPLERAAAVLARVGRPEEHAIALFNLGNLHLSLGDLDAATVAATRAAAVAPATGRASLYAELLAGDVERRRGAEQARTSIDRYAALRSRAPESEVPLVDAALAEACAEVGEVPTGRATIARLAALRESAGTEVSPSILRHVALAEARARLGLDPEAPLPPRLTETLREDADEAQKGQRRDRALRVQLLLVRDALRRGDAADARPRLKLAHTLFEEIRMRTPELRRAALAEDPDVKRLLALVQAADRPAEGAPSRRLLEINKRLNSELDLDRLLELILDTVIELSRAERGFLLMANPDGQLEVRMERNVEAVARAGVVAFSRSIADRAVSLGEAIVTVDAAGDQRFEAALSVTGLQLRSVLAVPLSVKGRAVGCVYVDHRARVGLFRPSDVALVSDLAEQAAIAVENARLLAENRARQVRIDGLNKELEARLASQTVELEGMHREVREARRVLGVRHDYAGLIGQTPRMVELFRLLDRVTDTHLPVVIYGESGTGKELVARALHHNGPRRKAAFVSESCGAIPETLLEAALFGHVRGAFTGAAADRRGLFEIADGGTLFLDEVGEMSPAMQVRLLRVLQEGEFRRVGGERVLKVDVRVLVASNRDLGKLVGEGRFREDLFYRLNVVRVALPPLRERTADIPLLVEHFLTRHPGTPGVTRRALERLSEYAWPGNIRQLENEIARAASMADGAIDLPDLSPQVQAGTDEADTSGPDALDLHHRVERLERSLLSEALQRTGGNQSEAARLLGLSRFGLQKKLRRYRIAVKARSTR